MSSGRLGFCSLSILTLMSVFGGILFTFLSSLFSAGGGGILPPALLFLSFDLTAPPLTGGGGGITDELGVFLLDERVDIAVLREVNGLLAAGPLICVASARLFPLARPLYAITFDVRGDSVLMMDDVTPETRSEMLGVFGLKL